ncbi:protein regulator of cytokinesis 1-like isoform X2 [Sinocyclocheilus anshuiensis]|uniref:protein regulator of cytokinesis 1-like isoform X2 n=1 Tax=Sinocyclocheilus anshuiensis TaxID=1608454 RepID=UPI0007B9C5A6|nr:PREDICTED: protein regulator of cytokinesis 1-like isoform X2 [Sinocyclocheilus anshuiensis]
MKKIKQTEEDLLYGTIIRTPTKRRLAGTPTPGKARKLTSRMCSSTPNTTLRSICSSPSLRPPLSSSKLCARTPARGRTPRGLERNKENISHLSGALHTMAASPQINYSITSVASSYSEFADSESTAASRSVYLKMFTVHHTNTHSSRLTRLTEEGLCLCVRALSASNSEMSTWRQKHNN